MSFMLPSPGGPGGFPGGPGGGFPGGPGGFPGGPGGGFPGGPGGFPGGPGGGFPGGPGGFPGGPGGGFPGGPGGLPGGPGGGPQPPSSPPPQAVPIKPLTSTLAVDPGAIAGCSFRFTYVWPRFGPGFWFYPVFVGRTSVAGFRWTGFSWAFSGLDTRSIESFTC